MSHTMNVRCGHCHELIVDLPCPECGPLRDHGYTWQYASEWAAKVWPEHECFHYQAARSRVPASRKENEVKYTVNTDSPTWGVDMDRNNRDVEFRLGDVVEVSDPHPDDDGDVKATNLTRGGESNANRFIALSCLTPLEDVEAAPTHVSLAVVRAVLAASGASAEEINRTETLIVELDKALA